MAASRTAWTATRRPRRRTWVRRTLAGLTALLGTAALVVFAAAGGIDDLRSLLPSDVPGPVIAPVGADGQDAIPVSAPVTGGGVDGPTAPAHEEAAEPESPPQPEPDVHAPAVEQEEEAPTAPEPARAPLSAIQEQLRELGYLVGPADGVHGAQSRAAVMAFQRVNGLQVDGVIGPRTRAALAEPRVPELADGPATRIEVDLDEQLLHLVEDGERVVTLHVSSGSGRPYTTASAATALSNTPVGEFTIERRIAGPRRAALGTLYDPLYFHRGWAIHGSDSVPAEPDSHGCIRVTRGDARWLFGQVADGTPVHVAGGTHVFVPSGT